MHWMWPWNFCRLRWRIFVQSLHGRCLRCSVELVRLRAMRGGIVVTLWLDGMLPMPCRNVCGERSVCLRKLPRWNLLDHRERYRGDFLCQVPSWHVVICIINCMLKLSSWYICPGYGQRILSKLPPRPVLHCGRANFAIFLFILCRWHLLSVHSMR